MGRSDRLFHLSGESWEIRDDTRVAARLDQSELRMSLLWKARIFRDEAHRESFEDPAFDLTPALIAEIFLQDLNSRGVSHEAPADPLDLDWQKFLAGAYPPPFNARTVDYLK